MQGESGVDYGMGGENEVKVLGAGYVKTVKILVYMLSPRRVWTITQYLVWLQHVALN